MMMMLLQVERQRRIVPSGLLGRKGVEVGEEGRGVSTMSQEVLKVFSQIRLLEEQHSSSLNLTSALHAELVAAHARVRELEAPHRKVETLAKRFAEEKAAWKVKEKERVKAAVAAVREELEEERAARAKVESANRRLTKELMDSQAATATALQDLENERKARHLLEDVCQELAKETSNDKAAAEETKREAQKVREELEEERRMLQLAEVWREERVQMKLGEAKLALEEKSAALDVMKDELESFLKSHHDASTVSSSFSQHHLRDAHVLHDVMCAISSSTFLPTTTITSHHHLPHHSESSSSLQDDAQHHHHRHHHHDDDLQTRNSEPLYYPEGIPDAD